MQEITDQLLSTEIDNTVHVTIVITGTPGFGKSTIAIALCHQPLIKKYFPNGFHKIELGLTPRKKYYMLSQIYRTLTGNTWTNPTSNPQGAVSEDDMVTCLSEDLSTLCKKNAGLLVIIDDVWVVKDAEDYVKIFSGCKIVLTTRREDVASSIDCKHKIYVDSMESSEAIQLLTFNITELQIDNSDIAGQLNELAMNVHNWPLLLNLVRGQLHRHCKTNLNSPLAAIGQVTKRLYNNGLTAFDREHPNRENAVNASIKASLDLLSVENVTRLNRLITTMFFGEIIPKEMLVYIWQLSNEEVDESCIVFWSVGLISYASSSYDQTCVKIHSVITQYIIDSIKVENLLCLGPSCVSDMNNITKYWMSKLQMGVDCIQLRVCLMDIVDSAFIFSILYKLPLLIQTMLKGLTNGVIEMKRNTFVRVKDQCKTLISYLNDGKNDQAVTFIIDELQDNCIQHIMKHMNYYCSFIEVPHSTRSAIDLMPAILPPCVKYFVGLRTCLYNYLIRETISLDKLNAIMTAQQNTTKDVTFGEAFQHELRELLPSFDIVYDFMSLLENQQ